MSSLALEEKKKMNHKILSGSTGIFLPKIFGILFVFLIYILQVYMRCA